MFMRRPGMSYEGRPGAGKGETHLPIKKLLNRRQPLFPIYAYPNLFPFVVFLNRKYDGRYIEVAKNGVYEMYLLRFGPYDICESTAFSFNKQKNSTAQDPPHLVDRRGSSRSDLHE